MHFLFKKLRAIIRWILVAFFGSTILAVVALRFFPVYFTPLMFIRCYEQVKEGRELKLSHHWVSIDKISPNLPKAVMGSEDAKFLAHHGFDYEAIEHAAKRNRQHPEKTQTGCLNDFSTDGQECVLVAWSFMGQKRFRGIFHHVDRVHVAEAAYHGSLS